MTQCENCGKKIINPSSACYYCGFDSNSGQKIEKNVKAIASLVLGILGLICWIIPLIGFPVNIGALILGGSSMGMPKKGMGIAGMVLSIIGLVLTYTSNTILKIFFI